MRAVALIQRQIRAQAGTLHTKRQRSAGLGDILKAAESLAQASSDVLASNNSDNSSDVNDKASNAAAASEACKAALQKVSFRHLNMMCTHDWL
jgi:hypothetical protein